MLYNNVFGAKMKLVTGYHGTNDMTLAMERGEIDGVCGLSWSTLKARHLQWMKDKQINVVVQAALQEAAGARRRAAGDRPDQGSTRSSRSSSCSWRARKWRGRSRRRPTCPTTARPR